MLSAKTEQVLGNLVINNQYETTSELIRAILYHVVVFLDSGISDADDTFFHFHDTLKRWQLHHTSSPSPSTVMHPMFAISVARAQEFLSSCQHREMGPASSGARARRGRNGMSR